jgi:hypothetical protein
MYRDQLQHIILEIGERFDLKDIYIIGTSAILAWLPDAPIEAVVMSNDVDVIPMTDEERLADKISFVIGEASDFDKEYGYYAQGVTSNTPTFAPRGWKSRTIPVRVKDYTGWCMDPLDLVLSESGADREKDIEFVREIALLKLLNREELLDRVPAIDCSPEDHDHIAERVRSLFAIPTTAPKA